MLQFETWSSKKARLDNQLNNDNNALSILEKLGIVFLNQKWMLRYDQPTK